MRSVIVDDEESARHRLRRLLAAHPAIEVAARGATARNLVQAASEDPSWLSNRRMRLVSELADLFRMPTAGGARQRSWLAYDGWLETGATDKVRGPVGEVTLDFSALARIDTRAVRAMEQLANLAGGASVHVFLRAVNGDVYRVLKLLKLADRFSFLN